MFAFVPPFLEEKWNGQHIAKYYEKSVKRQENLMLQHLSLRRYAILIAICAIFI